MPKYKSKEFLSASDSEDSGSGVEVPKGKKKAAKQKIEETKKEDPPAKKSKMEKKSSHDDAGGEDDVDSWEIGRSRKVKINEFRGKKLVDIREYYDKDGQEMPGRKGISLNVQQWRALMDVADQVDHALNKV